MRSVGIKVLKNRLSEYVRAASAGETVLVTDRDRVVAELVPPRQALVSDEDFIAMGVREGWLTPAKSHGPLRAPTCPPDLTLSELLDELAKDREDR